MFFEKFVNEIKLKDLEDNGILITRINKFFKIINYKIYYKEKCISSLTHKIDKDDLIFFEAIKTGQKIFEYVHCSLITSYISVIINKEPIKIGQWTYCDTYKFNKKVEKIKTQQKFKEVFK